LPSSRTQPPAARPARHRALVLDVVCRHDLRRLLPENSRERAQRRWQDALPRHPSQQQQDERPPEEQQQQRRRQRGPLSDKQMHAARATLGAAFIYLRRALSPSTRIIPPCMPCCALRCAVWCGTADHLARWRWCHYSHQSHCYNQQSLPATTRCCSEPARPCPRWCVSWRTVITTVTVAADRAARSAWNQPRCTGGTSVIISRSGWINTAGGG
jgi:hypothetical protein